MNALPEARCQQLTVGHPSATGGGLIEPSALLHSVGDALAYVRLAVHLHESGLSWLAYNLTAVSPRNHWTGAGLQRLMTNPPISYDRWVHLPAWRLHRLVDARALGYVHAAHLAELAVVLVALARVWWLRRRRRALRRASARAAGWPAPPRLATLGVGPGTPAGGAGSGVALGGVVILARLVWFLGRAPFLLVAALHSLASGTPAAGGGRTAKVAGKEGERGVRALKRGGWLSSHGWPVGTVGRGLARRTITLNHELQCAHVMVSGSPGSGKSKTQLVPWVLSEIALPPKLRASMILMDPKPDAEITNSTIAVMERAGWRTWVYDPFSPGSMRINALGLCADSEEVEALVDAWVIGVIGVDHPTVGGPAKRVLAAVAIHLRTLAEEGWARVSLADVARYIAADEDGDACLSLAGIKEKSKGITAMDGARDATRVLLNPHVAASMDGQDWDTAAFLAVPTIVYVPIMMGKRGSTRPFFTTLFPLMFNAFTRASGGLPLRRRVRILADEFANMSPVKAFDDFISAVRYLDVGVAIASQGVNDIKVMYGSDWSRIEASLTTRLHLPRKGVAVISQEAAVPILVTTHFWMKRDRLMALRVRRGQRRLTKSLALARQARGHGAAPALAASLAIEGPHDGDTRRLDTAAYTAITEELTPYPHACGGEPADKPLRALKRDTVPTSVGVNRTEEQGEEVGHEPMTTASTATASMASTATPRRTYPHICAWGPCGVAFKGRASAVYCSSSCRSKAHHAQRTQQGQTAV